MDPLVEMALLLLLGGYHYFCSSNVDIIIVAWYKLDMPFENLLQHFHHDYYSQIEHTIVQIFPPMENVDDNIFLELEF
jgi:hypothetical protein